MSSDKPLADLASALLSGAVRVVDLSAPLGPDTPIINLPPQVGKNSPPVKVHSISKYDSDGPGWAWNWYELGEHTGTHFDAPRHWITGKNYSDGATDTIPPNKFVAPVNVIDRSKEASANADYLLTVDSIKEWEKEHGEIESGTWVLLRTDWYKRNSSADTFLNADAAGPHYPGPTAEAIQYLVSKGVIGWGSEAVATEAGGAGGWNPPFPAHHYMHGANRCGLASLCHLDQLPPKGAVLIAAPLKFIDGTGSPVRALAIVPA
jgi:kynurenine formamidase